MLPAQLIFLGPRGILISSFSQWRLAFKKDKTVKHITWVCGSERILVEEIVQNIRGNLNPDPWNFVTLFAGDESERTIWSEVWQLPMGHGGYRLTVVRNAEKLKKDEFFEVLIRDRLSHPNNYVVFVSNEEELSRIAPGEGEKLVRGKGELIPRLAGMKGKGHTIECKPFTDITAKHAVVWVQEKAKIKPVVAAHLLNRSDGDLRIVRDVCNKLSVFPGEITLTVINDMLAQRPRDSFVDALMALDKKTALMALRELPRSEWSRTIGLLDSRLELAGMVHDMQIDHKSPGEIAKAAGTRSFLIKDVLPVSKHYDSKRRLKIREVLSLVDEYRTTGYPEGSMSVLVNFW